jgi:flagellar basal body-associated protein FliL
MSIISLISLISIVIILFLIVGVIPLWMVNAQTPTTSDLPATIGNESNSDLALTNNTLPVENATTVTPLSSK